MRKKEKINVKDRVVDNVCDLSLSGLNEVPLREIIPLKRVNVLDLSNNNLASLNNSFIILTRLVKLDLSKNQIQNLPKDFGELYNLRHLDLYDNKIEYLPLSFGNLTNLRYLDLKGNPLAPSLADVVGFCLTNKECHESARKTVSFFADLQIQAKNNNKTIQKTELDKNSEQSEIIIGGTNNENNKTNENDDQNQVQKMQIKFTKTQKKSKPKNKIKSNNLRNNQNDNNSNNNNNSGNHNNTPVNNSPSNLINNTKKDLTNHVTKTKPNNKTNKNKKSKSLPKSSIALATIFTFCILLALNVILCYMLMFSYSETVEKLIELIPHQYRDWICTKTEMFRLRVTDWISEFRTPPDEQ